MFFYKFVRCILLSSLLLRYGVKSVAVHGGTFVENKALQGGAICIMSPKERLPTADITDSTFENNDAFAYSGGALAFSGVDVTIERTAFRGNEARVYGGAVRLLRPPPPPQPFRTTLHP